MKKLKKSQLGINIPQQPDIQPAQTPTIDSWYAQNQDTANYRPITPQPETERQFDPMQPNAWALGLMGAYAGSKLLLNKSREKNYEKYKADWIRRYSIPSLIQDPNKFSSIQYEAPMAKRGGIMQTGGLTMNTSEQQGAGYFAYPNASSLTFPGKGERTFVPGPFPLMVKDDKGTQIMTNKPIKTRGRVIEIPIFEEGGEVRKQAITVDRADATIEAEKGELILGAGAPGDIEDQEKRVGVGLYRVGGKSHARGGTPLLAHPGDFVFSNDKSLAVSEEQSKLLVGKEIKKLKLRTPAKLAQKYLDLNEFIDMAQDEKMDPITRKTAMLNINNFVDRLAEIAYVQEEKKDFPDGVPAFVQASLDTRFDAKGLQQDMEQFRQGGSVLPKHQTKGMVSTEIRDKSRLVDTVPPGYDYIGNIEGKKYYRNAQGQLVQADVPQGGGKPSSGWRQSIIDRVKAGQNPDDLMKTKMIGDPAFRDELMQYYNPAQKEDYVYTPDNGQPNTWQWPNMDRGPLPTAPNRPGIQFNPTNPGESIPDEDKLTNYIQGSNGRFNVNTAEAYNLLASALPSESRYPTAYRNEEIQNAKALTASTGRPISEQPYLNSNRRNLLGYDQNNNASGAAGATRGLAAYSATLGADNQAISQVYNQNILRGDQRNQQLAQLEIADGQDRIGNAEKYDNKLEMLANNKERERKNIRQNIGLQINQMQKDRESKRLFNVMSDYYQINRDNSIGLKPTYKIENGKVVPYQRNVADLIRSSGTSTNGQYLERARQIFELMNQYGIKSGAFVDEIIRDATNPTGIPK